MEIRLYYESLEQAHDYIAPLIKPHVANIRLIKKIQKDCSRLSGIMKAVHLMVAPDILITAVIDSREIPLAVVEFTEAVKAEDHELQRSYGAIAGFFGDFFYLKISGHKESTGEFGAGVYDPYTTPRMLHEEYGYDGFIIAEWETVAGNPQQLQHTPDLFGCPPHIPIVEDTIKCALQGVSKDIDNWFSIAVDQLRDTESFAEFSKRRDNAETLEALLASWQKRAKQRYFVNDSYAGCKLNRFGHAMDPDRGIIILISTLLSKSHKIYGEYAIVRPRSKTLNVPVGNLEQLKEQFPKVIKFDGMPKWFQKMLNDIVNELQDYKATRNIHSEFKKHAGERWGTVVKTLAYFCDGIRLGKDGPLLTWNREDFLGGKLEDNFHDTIRKYLGFDQPSPVTPLTAVDDIVDEDEVTYILAHRVLIPNGFKIVSISYPGAQGGTAILPDVGEGKRQKRIYIDLIACPPGAGDPDRVLLNESKGMFNERAVEEDIEKINYFKSSKKHKSALNVALRRAKVLQPNGVLRDVVIGISFGVTNSSATIWNPGTVDFIFRIEGRTKWAIGIFDQNLSEQIKQIAGKTDFPPTYKFNPN